MFSAIPVIWKYVGAGVLVLALVAAIIFGVKGCKQIDQENNNAIYNNGVVAEQSASREEVINHVQEARNAVDRPTSNELNVVCERYDRNCPHR